MLQPIVQMLQYRAFCDGIEYHLNRVVSSLQKVQLPTTLRFSVMGPSGHDLIEYLFADQDIDDVIGGDALLRIDNRCVGTTHHDSPRRMLIEL
jgi:mediator of RNA polymerase II transcription subunit 17